ncbi:MAG: glycoside hydrolase family 3 protein [Ruminococcus sp.]|nr:glycoside hydrolase family 3 protein [Ruminococcus sp.]
MKKLILPMLLLSLLMAGCKEEEKVVELTPVSVSSVETEAATTQKSTKSPTEPTTATEEEVKISPRVQRKLKKMDIHEKVCQMFMAVPEKTTYYYDTLTYVDDWYKKCYEEYPIGGYIYFDANIVWEQQLCDLLSDSQEMAAEYNNGIGLFQAVDEEGGSVTRVQKMLWKTPVENMSYYGKLNDYNTTYEAGRTIGTYLNACGFNVNFAPVADVNISEANELGSRIFSSDPLVVSDMCTAIIKGLKSQKVASTLKHFPGLGAGTGNTHYETVEIDRSLEELEITEFPAFKGGIDAGADFVMVGHQIVKAAGDKLPADLSSVVVTDWLREKLGFEGIVITDSQSMGAITNNYTSGEAAIKSIEAGVDIILMPNDLRAAVDDVEAAVKSGKLSEERIDESVIRILEKKNEMGLLD